jgi:hypothetical protein
MCLNDENLRKSTLPQLWGRELGKGISVPKMTFQVESLLPLTLTLSPREREHPT